jgi:protein-L-isoaspartate(D-aspartate) O-methyltransferase
MIFNQARLDIVRRAYARQILAVAGAGDNLALEEAFARVPRERFIGPEPWQIVGLRGYQTLPSADPVLVYQDVMFALSPGRGVNNGSPLLHALWLNALGPLEGARVAHVGAGTGYYSAILSRLVGESGQVLAVEYDAALVERAERNLAGFDNVSLIQGDGGALAFEPIDAIYVNFAVGRPAEHWIDALKPGGRLIFPLGSPGRRRRRAASGQHADGAGFRIERRAQGFAASWLGAAFFVGAEGVLAPSADEREHLHAAFENGGAALVRSMRWKEPPALGRSWFVGTGWSLSYEDVPG